jgi:autotransporter-associated beta strand protein
MAALVAAWVMAAPSMAATFTWDGGGSFPPFNNNNWSNLVNWENNSIPTNDGTADVVIPNTPRDNPVVDMSWSIDTLTFQGGGNYTLSGQPLTIAGNLSHNGTGTATINNTLTLSGDSIATWRANTGPLIINGSIAGSQSNFFLHAPHPITFDGTAANAFADLIRFREGTLILSKPATNGAIVGDIQVGLSTGAAATLFWAESEQVSQAAGVSVNVDASGMADLNGKIETLDRLFVGGIFQGAAGKLTILSQLIIGGAIDMGAGELVAPPIVANAGTDALGFLNDGLLRLASPKTDFRIGDRSVQLETEVNATIADSSLGPSSLHKSFDGALRLTAANTYTGGTVIEEGTLRVDNATGSGTGTGAVSIEAGGFLTGGGAISGTVSVDTNAGYSPASNAAGLAGAIGSLNVGGLLLGVGANSQFQLNDSESGLESDLVAVSGTVHLDGQLNVRLLSVNAPSSTATATIISSTSLNGSFANAPSGSRVPALDGLGFFRVHYGAASPFNANNVVLSSFVLAADFDENGAVNGADLSKWKMNLGTASGASHMQGDANGDGDVDGADFLVWQRQLGNSTSPAAPIPESAGILIASTGLCYVAWRSGIQRRSN